MGDEHDELFQPSIFLSKNLQKHVDLGGGFNFFNFHPNLGKWSNLTKFFEMGWFNHQLVIHTVFFEKKNILRSPPRNGAKTL